MEMKKKRKKKKNLNYLKRMNYLKSKEQRKEKLQEMGLHQSQTTGRQRKRGYELCLVDQQKKKNH